MTAKIIHLPQKPRGNGAREALIAIAMDTGTCPAMADMWVDSLLLELWMRGFMIVRNSED